MEALKDKHAAAAAVQRYAHLTAQLGVLLAAKNEALTRVESKHQPAITAVSSQLGALRDQLEEWAHGNRDLFGEAKSLEFSHGFLRFRLGNRKIECLARWTPSRVLKKLLSFPVTSQWQEYVRREPEINKQKLLEQTKEGGKLPPSRLWEVGLKITREEGFDIETKPEMVARDCDLMP